MVRPATATLALAAALALAACAAAQAPTGWSCSQLPNDWGQNEQQENSNPAWGDLQAGNPSEEVLARVYSTAQNKLASEPPLAGWPNCETPTNAVAGCQQNYGEGQNAGMNLALQVNFTCGTSTLGVTADVNVYTDQWTSQTYINVDDYDLEFLAENGAITQGSLDDMQWWEANDDLWGQLQTFTPQPGQENQQNNDQDNNDENDNDDNNNNQNNDQQQNSQQQG